MGLEEREMSELGPAGGKSWWLQRRKLATEESEEEHGSLQTRSCEWLFGDRME